MAASITAKTFRGKGETTGEKREKRAGRERRDKRDIKDIRDIREKDGSDKITKPSFMSLVSFASLLSFLFRNGVLILRGGYCIMVPCVCGIFFFLFG